MKKITTLTLSVMLLFIFAAHSGAGTYIPFSTNTLPNANPSTEEKWLEGLLGLTYDDPSVSYINKVEYVDGGPNSLTGYYPGFAWDYAVVKWGNWWTAFSDKIPVDDYLTILSSSNYGVVDNAGSPKDYGISHVTFFDARPVPEPGTFVLLGAGLILAAAVSRKRLLK